MKKNNWDLMLLKMKKHHRCRTRFLLTVNSVGWVAFGQSSLVEDHKDDGKVGHTQPENDDLNQLVVREVAYSSCRVVADPIKENKTRVSILSNFAHGVICVKQKGKRIQPHT
jgi:hypothetical protein